MEITHALKMLDETSRLLDGVVAELSPRRWLLPTPARGWHIADQIGHLLWTDELTNRAVLKEPGFSRVLERLGSGFEAGVIDRAARERGARPVPQLLEEWRSARSALAAALADADAGGRIAWFGPPMRPITLIAARIMETWAHSLDVFDALGRALPPTDALRAVARLGVRTREFAFQVRGLAVPEEPVRVELYMADGELLTFGPAEARERVAGMAWGFAAVVTQRRHLADVELEAVGEGAQRWMRIAQAFAGPPTSGPAPGVRLQWHGAGLRSR